MRAFAIGMLAAVVWTVGARADIAVSSNDAHTVLDAAANQVAAKDAPPDTVSIIDLKGEPRIVATVEAPGSVVGPPMAVAVAPDESFAIVTGATKADPAGTFGISPDDKVSVIDLTALPPKVVQSLTAGLGATTVRISPDGKLVLIANRTEGSVSIFTLADKHLTPVGKLTLPPTSMPSGIAFLPDGKRALLSRQAEHLINLLRIDGTNVTIDKRPITAAVSPYTVDITADGKWAAVGNTGRGDGDIDSVSLIDLSTEPFRTVQTLDVARSPEGVKWSPDGTVLAVEAQNGTTKAPGSPFYNPTGRLIMLRLQDGRFHQVTEAPIGRWSQGIAFSRDGRTVLVQNMVERNIQVFGWDGTTLTPKGALDMKAGPAAIQTPWK